jgi:hypothetical protein
VNAWAAALTINGEEKTVSARATDLVVETQFTEEGLDSIVRALPMCAAAVVQGSATGDTVTVRVFGDPGFLKFALENQGYGHVVAEREPS